MHHITLIHGIHTGLTDPNWTQHFQNYLELNLDQVTVETESYRAGIFAPWNLWVKNPRIAKAHANRIAAFSEAYKRERGLPISRGNLPSLKIHLVAHSNGTNIAVGVVKRLARMGIRVETLILVGSAVHSDVDRSGLRQLVRHGEIRRAFAYCSDDDRVIRRLQSIPGFYGSLGSRGFERDGQPHGLKVEGFQPLAEGTPVSGKWGHDRWKFITRWFPGYSHGEWLGEEMRERTWQCFAGDMGVVEN